MGMRLDTANNIRRWNLRRALAYRVAIETPGVRRVRIHLDRVSWNFVLCVSLPAWWWLFLGIRHLWVWHKLRARLKQQSVEVFGQPMESEIWTVWK